ncbi:hypothetical protein ACEWY4_007099 [Coilia grayii]|uniref:HTH CENPB-type domain-containing protein n=1 Tax=Coilia grayii TaxID=363190 RepID=A0ABD1KFP3_9TELE
MPSKYSEEIIKQALLAVEEGGNLRRVAAQFGVPHTTLRDWRRGKYGHLPHPNRALLPNEEEALVSYILWMAAYGFPITQSVALVLAIQVCKASGRNNLFLKMDKGLSRMWWSRFRARHPTVASRWPNYIEAERVHGATVVRVDCCASAAGEVIPPFVIFEKCLPSTAYSLEGPPNALYGVSDTGYMDSDLFLKWLEHFVRYARQERPLLLFMDQHEAHPLDVSVYGPLKAAFTDMARCLGLVRDNLTIGKRNFTPVLKVALEQACNPHNIRSGFRKTGLFPLDRKAVDESKLVKGLHRPSDASSTSPSSTGEDAPTASTSSSVYTDAANAVPDTVPWSTTVDSTCDVAEDPSTTTSSTVSSHRGPATITITTTVLTPWGSPASSSSATTTSPASSSPTIIATGSSSPTIAAASSSSPTMTRPGGGEGGCLCPLGSSQARNKLLSLQQSGQRKQENARCGRIGQTNVRSGSSNWLRSGLRRQKLPGKLPDNRGRQHSRRHGKRRHGRRRRPTGGTGRMQCGVPCAGREECSYSSNVTAAPSGTMPNVLMSAWYQRAHGTVELAMLRRP